MRDANYELRAQREQIDNILIYDNQINCYIDKATGRIKAIEKETLQKKILMISLAVGLGLMMIVLLGMRVAGWFTVTNCLNLAYLKKIQIL